MRPTHCSNQNGQAAEVEKNVYEQICSTADTKTPLQAAI